ncbi:LSU ribosomal protein L20p [Candidatus Vidania fulgoroideae]|nr:LSU ribosomal protein L20p [Candidatus Vidania fulgoroideae]
MSRVKSCSVSRRKHKKMLKKVKGFIGRRKSCYRIAKQAYIKALTYSYRDRKRKKSFMKKECMLKFNLFLKMKKKKYSDFIRIKKKKNIILNIKSMYLLSFLFEKDSKFCSLFMESFFDENN